MLCKSTIVTLLASLYTLGLLLLLEHPLINHHGLIYPSTSYTDNISEQTRLDPMIDSYPRAELDHETINNVRHPFKSPDCVNKA